MSASPSRSFPSLRAGSTSHIVAATASRAVLCVTSITAAVGGLAGHVVTASSFSPQVPRRHGTSPRTAPVVSTCRVCPSCCWLSAVCKGLRLSSPAPPRPGHLPFSPATSSPSVFLRHPDTLAAALVFAFSSSASPDRLLCLSFLASLLLFLCFTQHLLYARPSGFRRKCCVQHSCPSGAQFQVGQTDRKFTVATLLDKCYHRDATEHFRSPFICL